MSKLSLVVAMLVILAVAAVPAMAQGFEQDIDPSGDVDQSSNIENSGDNSNQCAAPQQTANTGSVQNQQGFETAGSGGATDGADLLKAIENGDFGDNLSIGDLNKIEDALNTDNGGGGFDDAKFTGPSFEQSPSQSVECNQLVDQKAFAVGR